MSVLVYGDLMLDKYIDGNVTRISPEAPVPVVHVQTVYNAIGGCGNVSNGIAALGVENVLVALVGKDIHADEIKNLLQKAAIKMQLVVQNKPTIAKVRIVSNKHQLLRFDMEQVGEPEKAIAKKLQNKISNSNAKVAVISDYGKGICSDGMCSFILQTYKARNKKVLVDPKSSDWTKYSGAYLISPNFKEFCEALGKTIPNEDKAIEQHALQLSKKYSIENILVTRSAKGMSLIGKETTIHIPTIAKEVYDVTGAGDTVIATIAAMLSKGKKLKESVLLSNKAAAIAVAHFGTYAVTKKELFLK
jgi:rfaE bifunctional protein kinase chain/domain